MHKNRTWLTLRHTVRILTDDIGNEKELYYIYTTIIVIKTFGNYYYLYFYTSLGWSHFLFTAYTQSTDISQKKWWCCADGVYRVIYGTWPLADEYFIQYVSRKDKRCIHNTNIETVFHRNHFSSLTVWYFWLINSNVKPQTLY